jgi:hypothetical protein
MQIDGHRQVGIGHHQRIGAGSFGGTRDFGTVAGIQGQFYPQRQRGRGAQLTHDRLSARASE